MRTITFDTEGTCSTRIRCVLEGSKIVEIEFSGGCSGNLRGLGALVRGMEARDVMAKLSGIQCGDSPTSCPDQLARALESALEGCT